MRILLSDAAWGATWGKVKAMTPREFFLAFASHHSVAVYSSLAIIFAAMAIYLATGWQELLLPPQLTLPGQLPMPLQRRSHWSASQRTSLMQAPCASQRISHELPPHRTLPAQLLVPPHCTVQLSASWQSTPLEHDP